MILLTLNGHMPIQYLAGRTDEALELKQRMAASGLNEAKEMMVIPSLACCLSYKANSLSAKRNTTARFVQFPSERSI